MSETYSEGGGETFRHAETDIEIAACFPVMRLLRPHLTGPENCAPGFAARPKPVIAFSRRGGTTRRSASPVTGRRRT